MKIPATAALAALFLLSSAYVYCTVNIF